MADEKKDEAKKPKEEAKPKLKLAEKPKDDAKAELEAAAEAAPAADRSAVIITNGTDVRIGPSQMTGLELCEACRRILKALGG